MRLELVAILSGLAAGCLLTAGCLTGASVLIRPFRGRLTLHFALLTAASSRARRPGIGRTLIARTATTRCLFPTSAGCLRLICAFSMLALRGGTRSLTGALPGRVLVSLTLQ